MVARTELAGNSNEAAAAAEPSANPRSSPTVMSMFASLHRKLIVQQVRDNLGKAPDAITTL